MASERACPHCNETGSHHPLCAMEKGDLKARISALETALGEAVDLASGAIAYIDGRPAIVAHLQTRLAKLKAVRDGKEPQRKEGSQ